jgi:hypothetical protein
VTQGRQGQPPGSKLDTQADFIFALLDEKIDISLCDAEPLSALLIRLHPSAQPEQSGGSVIPTRLFGPCDIL